MSSSEDIGLWDTLADRYASVAGQPEDSFYRRAVPALETAIGSPAGQRILDVGCGHGWIACQYAARGADVVGVDGSPRLVDKARTEPSSVEWVVLVGGVVSVDITDGGCCGSTYQFRATRGDGTAFGCPGAELVVSPAAPEVLHGAKLDYSGRVKPPRFRVLANPNTPQRCPCNRSFGQPWPGRGCQQCQVKSAMPWDQ